MAKLTVTYFDFAGSRGEEVRLALTVAGVPFEDNRIERATLATLKPDLPFGSLPVLDWEGHGTFAQSNAILRLIGRQYGLHPEEPFEAARHDALMDAAEDLRHRLGPTCGWRAARRERRRGSSSPPSISRKWGRFVDRLIGDGPFVAGQGISVADIKLYIVERWISSGSLDDIPADVFAPCGRLKALARAVRDHPAIVGWYAAAS